MESDLLWCDTDDLRKVIDGEMTVDEYSKKHKIQPSDRFMQDLDQ